MTDYVIVVICFKILIFVTTDTTDGKRYSEEI